MNLSALQALVPSLAGDALVTFFVVGLIDLLFGVAVAVKGRTFDWGRLPDFLASQYATKEFVVVAIAWYTASTTGGDGKAAALSIVTAGGSALTVKLLADIWSKASILFQRPAPVVAPPAPAPAPAPVVVPDPAPVAAATDASAGPAPTA